MLQEGIVAPSFVLPDQHGDLVSLDDLRGSWVVFWWYPKASTAG
jgi:peroxiredoxin Q/BCP